MKTSQFLFTSLVFSALFTSCAPVYYYQVYRATPTNNVVSDEKYLVYEDENCMVSYNLWSKGGDIGFKFFNKTDNNIYLNLSESFFIINGFAYDYYKNRIFTNSKNLSSATSKFFNSNTTQSSNILESTTSSGYSVSFNENKIICIPSKTSKIITEFNIIESIYNDCFLIKYPTKKQIKSKNFTKNDSPYIFSNRIGYFIEGTDNLIKFENEFYINEITNYPESEIIELRYDVICGKKSSTLSKHFKDASPDKFYIKYTKVNNTW